jgi:hypothetical protein
MRRGPPPFGGPTETGLSDAIGCQEGACICEDCLDLVTQRAAKYSLEKSLAKRDVAYTEK